MHSLVLPSFTNFIFSDSSLLLHVVVVYSFTTPYFLHDSHTIILSFIVGRDLMHLVLDSYG